MNLYPHLRDCDPLFDECLGPPASAFPSSRGQRRKQLDFGAGFHEIQSSVSILPLLSYHCSFPPFSRDVRAPIGSISLLFAVKPWSPALIFFSRYNHGDWYISVEDRHIKSIRDSGSSIFQGFCGERRWWYWNNNTTLPISDVDLGFFGCVVFH